MLEILNRKNSKSDCEQISHMGGLARKKTFPNKKSNGSFPKARDWAQGLWILSNLFDLLRK